MSTRVLCQFQNEIKTGPITISWRLTLWLDSEENLFALLHGLHSLAKRQAEVTCSVILLVTKKTRPTGGWWPRVFPLRRRSSHTDRENLRTPAPILTQWYRNPVRTGPEPNCALAPGGERVDFFNLSLKFAPTKSRTQDLRSAVGPPNRLD